MPTLLVGDMDKLNQQKGLNGLYKAHKEVTPPGSPPNEAEEDDVEEEGIELDIRKVEEQLRQIMTSCYDSSDDSSNDTPSLPPPPVEELPIHQAHAYPCRATHQYLPAPTSKWPQAPVMLRPSPRTHTKIRGIRYASSSTYNDYSGFCAGCILPINNGSEAPGKSLVVDFETKYFVGTLLMRIKEAPAASSKDQTSQSYFDGKKRRFQSIVKGRFKQEINMADCYTGQVFHRAGGKLPAKFIVNSFIRFVSTLAPQLEATLEGTNPRFLTPLAATAHTVLQRPIESNTSACYYCTEGKTDEEKRRLLNYTLYSGAQDIEAPVSEPPADAPESILSSMSNTTTSSASSSSSSVAARQKNRKRALNAVSAKRDTDVKFLPDMEYTFEFYQHLLLFGDELAIDMGMAIGKVGLAGPLAGQPLKFMATKKEASGKLEPLWSFDIWHASLYPLAYAHDRGE